MFSGHTGLPAPCIKVCSTKCAPVCRDFHFLFPITFLHPHISSKACSDLVLCYFVLILPSWWSNFLLCFIFLWNIYYHLPLFYICLLFNCLSPPLELHETKTPLLCSQVYGISGEGNGTPLQYSCIENPMDGGAWWAAFHGVSTSQSWLSDFTFTFHFHAMEKEMATYSSVLVWRIPGTADPGGLLSMGLHRVGHD